MKTTEEIYDECGFIPFVEFAHERTYEQIQFMKQKWFSEAEVKQLLDKLEKPYLFIICQIKEELGID